MQSSLIHRKTLALVLLVVFVQAVARAARAEPPTPEAKCAVERLASYVAGQAKGTEAKLVFVYFTPADREPPAGYRKRLGRVMGDIREFYDREMAYHGLGHRTIRYDSDADGALVVYDVKGKQPTEAYLEHGRETSKGDLIRKEARPVLEAAGIDDKKVTVIYFCDLRTEKDGRVTGVGPYYGSGSFTGSFHAGRCWFTDATILDPDRLSDKTTKLFDEQYRRISVGRYNSIFMGGAAHELGHALGLPHDKERKDEAPRGTSLMGSGNRTYGEERRGEGRGSMLTLADALRLASHPMFNGGGHKTNLDVTCRLEDLAAKVRNGQLELTGRLVATPEPYAVIAYNDPDGDNDYDATTWTAPLDADNRFALHIGQFKPGLAELRLVICHVNGGTSLFRYTLTADAEGTPDAAPLIVVAALHDALQAWAAGNSEEVQKLAVRAAETNAGDETVTHWAKVLETIAAPQPQWPGLAEVPAATATISLSRVQWQEASVGWAKPARNHFPHEVDPEMPLLNIGGRYRADGLYAHAPSRYVFDLNGQWKTFTADVGLQAGAGGSAVFVVKGDGKELFRSEKLQGAATAAVKIDVTGVKTLELLTEAADGNNREAWAVWGDPMLGR